MVRDFDGDVVFDFGIFHPIERALGQKISEHRDDVPAAATPLIKSREDFDRLPERLSIRGKEWVDYQIGVIKKLKRRVGEGVPLLGLVSSPFLSACHLRGTENLYLDLYEAPDFVKALVEYLVEPILEYGELQVEAGVDIIHTVCPVGSRTMISRNHYEEFVHPVHVRVFDHWKNVLHRRVFFHVCGDWSDRFDLVVEEGPDILHVDQIDLALLKREFGSRICINGNVATATTMLRGSPEDVKIEAISCIGKAGPGGGFMLGANCLVPRDTPLENMRALVDAVSEAGYYPFES
jgi:uroporphyrinogen decarboxylase